MTSLAPAATSSTPPDTRLWRVLDGGDAGTHELERGVERIQMDVDPACPQSVVGPELQGQVRRAELQRRQTDMVVCVDEPGEDDEIVAADHVRTVVRRKAPSRADLHDRPVTNKHRRVVHLGHVPVRVDAAHDRSSPHHGCLHVAFLRRLGSWIADGPPCRCMATQSRARASQPSLPHGTPDRDAARTQECYRVRLRYACRGADSNVPRRNRREWPRIRVRCRNECPKRNARSHSGSRPRRAASFFVCLIRPARGTTRP